MSGIPPPPPGFKLDREKGAPPPPPPGFTLDAPAPVDPHVKSAPQTTGQDEAAKNANTKEKGLEGVLSFLSGGGPLMDEIAGVSAIGDPRKFRPGESVLDTYRRVRDSIRRDVGSATRRASPTVGVMGHQVPVLPLAGAVLPSLAAPNPATILGRIGVSGAVGASQAAGESTADLTQGDVGGFRDDVVRGGGTGLLAAGAAEGLSVPMKAIARGAASRIGDAVATRAAKDTADVAGEVASLQGKANSEAQKLSRYFENTQRGAGGGVAPAGSSPLDPAIQQRAMMALTDPAAAAAQGKIVDRSARMMGPQTGVVSRLDQEAAAKAAGASKEAADRTSGFFAKPTITTDVLPRIGRQLQNAAIGGAAALPTALAAGAGFGKAGAGLALAGGIGTGFSKGALSAARTTMANPRLQVGALESLINASQAGQRALRTGAQSTAAVTPQLAEDEEAAVQAFLSSR